MTRDTSMLPSKLFVEAWRPYHPNEVREILTLLAYGQPTDEWVDCIVDATQSGQVPSALPPDLIHHVCFIGDAILHGSDCPWLDGAADMNRVRACTTLHCYGSAQGVVTLGPIESSVLVLCRGLEASSPSVLASAAEFFEATSWRGDEGLLFAVASVLALSMKSEAIIKRLAATPGIDYAGLDLLTRWTRRSETLNGWPAAWSEAAARFEWSAKTIRGTTRGTKIE